MYQNDLHNIFDETCDPTCLGTLKINSLSWADDLVIVSKSALGLQNCLNKLYLYCQKWGLNLNTQKTKCIEFLEGAKSKNSFYYHNMKLENVNEYTYLGIKFHKSGKFNIAIKDRMAKASRAMYILRQALCTVKNVNTKLATSLFDKQILPILSYGCSVWSLPHTNNYMYIEKVPNDISISDIKSKLTSLGIKITMCKRMGRISTFNRPILLQMENSDEKIKLIGMNDLSNIHRNASLRNYDTETDKQPYEKLHTKFCKYALGVSKFSSNHACRAELGRFPICFKMWKLCLQYWLRLENGTDNIILNQAYQCNKEENHYWYQSIKYLLCINGLGNIWYCPPIGNTYSIKRNGNILRKRLEEQYIQHSDTKCLSSDIYNTLSFLHDSYRCSQYLSDVKNVIIRANITKLRIGDIKLNYYTGLRLHKSKTCEMCNNNAEETVEHFILNCTKYEEARSILIQKLSQLHINFPVMNTVEKMKFILNIDNSAISVICNYLTDILKSRNIY